MEAAAAVGRKRRRRQIAAAVLVVLVAAGTLGWFVTNAPMIGRGEASSVGAPEGMTEDIPIPMASPLPPMLEKDALGYGDDAVRATGDVSVEAAAPSSGGATDAVVFQATDQSVTTPTVGPRVIKTADLSLVLEDEGFSTAFDKASMVASKYEGFVIDSYAEGTHSKAGSLTMRVPVASYDDALSDLRVLGIEIERETSSGVDVTDQFIDLDARLRSWESQHRALLKLMENANSISATIEIQQEIQRVEAEIEAIRGQLRVLRDQASMATITVSMHERGAASPKGDTERPSLAAAFDTAIAATLGIVSLVIVGLGYILPILILAATAWMAWRWLRRTPKTVTG